MSRHILQLIIFMAFLCLLSPVQAAPFEVTNIKVSIQAKDAVKARDQAITKAQRLAFATLVDKNEEQISSISDAQIARLVRGFSLRGERLAARSYGASFAIRFNPGAIQNFAQSNGFIINPQAFQGEIVVSATTTVTATPKLPGQVLSVPKAATPQAAEPAKPELDSVVVLPVLDIGSRQIVWDEPNPWRVIWQKQDHSTPALQIQLPLGDITDVTEIPDTGFLNNGHADIQSLLSRYKASHLYVIVARNQASGGLLLSLYDHDGSKLKFVRKNIVQARPGFLFDDALPIALQMIKTAYKGAGNAEVVTENVTNTVSAETETPLNTPLTVTVPYQSLQQWVGIQKRLKLVAGIKSALPMRLSSSSAQVRIQPFNTTMEKLKQSLEAQGFALQNLANGEMALTER